MASKKIIKRGRKGMGKGSNSQSNRHGDINFKARDQTIIWTCSKKRALRPSGDLKLKEDVLFRKKPSFFVLFFFFFSFVALEKILQRDKVNHTSDVLWLNYSFEG
eukprot:TRINITY_DN3003_c1_g1_i1.p1 TRINITY_DN3003_c1_g1~~TRINITY_DN3003_c1_g1_i1.p1  ORF type:complete len:105 (-),score=8.18 TRINITY_DN3003_c1_g1_i1:245-559(-)